MPVSIVTHNAKGALSSLIWNGVTGTADLNALGLPRVAENGDLCYNRGSSVAGTLCPAGNAWNETVGSATSDISNWTIRVPDYINAVTGQRNPTSLSGVSVPGRYTFDVTLTDGNGRTAASNTSWLSIRASSLRTVLLKNASALDSSGNPVGHINNKAPIDGTTQVMLEAYLDNNGSGFHDYHAYTMFPPVASTPPAPVAPGTTQTVNTAITQADIDRLNELYTITSSSTRSTNNVVTLVNGNAYSSCDAASVPNCLLVQEIEEVAGDNTPSTLTDKYRIKVATTAALGQVDVQFKFPHYSSVASETVYFSTTSGASWLAIYEVSSGKMFAYGQVTGSSDTIIATADGGANPFVVDNTYEVRGFAVDPTTPGATPIAGLKYVWSLVGDNISACPKSSDGTNNNTVLNDFVTQSTGPWFNVSLTNQYTIKGKASVAGNSMASNGSSGLAVTGQPWGGAHPAVSPQACAGDQGFKLQVTAY